MKNQLRCRRNLFANYDKLKQFFTPGFLRFHHCFLIWLLQMQTRRVQVFKSASGFCRAILFLLFFSDKVDFPSVVTHLTNHSACRYQITIKRFKRDCFYSLHNVFVKQNKKKRQPLTNSSWWKKVAPENTCWWRWTAACLIPDSTWLHTSECPFQFPSTSTENPLLSGTEIWILHHLICSSQEPYLKRLAQRWAESPSPLLIASECPKLQIPLHGLKHNFLSEFWQIEPTAFWDKQRHAQPPCILRDPARFKQVVVADYVIKTGGKGETGGSPCMVTGSLRFQFRNLEHPTCQPPIKKPF